MRVLAVALSLAVLASCDEQACEDRGGRWGRFCGLAGCGDYHCYERLAEAGKPCTGYEDCPEGACEAPAGVSAPWEPGDPGGSGGGEPVVGHCCEYAFEMCRPSLLVEGGRVVHAPILD